jgi:hypothetical protein
MSFGVREPPGLNAHWLLSCQSAEKEYNTVPKLAQALESDQRSSLTSHLKERVIGRKLSKLVGQCLRPIPEERG